MRRYLPFVFAVLVIAGAFLVALRPQPGRALRPVPAPSILAAPKSQPALHGLPRFSLRPAMRAQASQRKGVREKAQTHQEERRTKDEALLKTQKHLR